MLRCLLNFNLCCRNMIILYSIQFETIQTYVNAIIRHTHAVGMTSCQKRHIHMKIMCWILFKTQYKLMLTQQYDIPTAYVCYVCVTGWSWAHSYVWHDENGLIYIYVCIYIYTHIYIIHVPTSSCHTYS